MRVLVIDDNPDDRQLVLREVEALFPTADIAEPTDMADVVAALGARVPDLVVTDLDLRWSNGRDVLALVKGRHPSCPVVMFTGTGDETTAVELMKSGLDDYVVKSPRQLGRLRTSLRLAVEAAASRAALTDREARLAAMVAHKDTLVRELHHRVRNNLQTVMSLLRLGGRQADPATRRRLDEIAGRMQAQAAVQARIYESEALDQVDVATALADIAQSLADAHGNNHVALQFDADGLFDLNVARAMPLGLLCHELILNALKHAWPNRQPGVLTVELRTVGGHPEVTIRDDGVGYRYGAVTEGIGLRLAASLAAEAGAEMDIQSWPGAGTTVTLALV